MLRDELEIKVQTLFTSRLKVITVVFGILKDINFILNIRVTFTFPHPRTPTYRSIANML